MTETNSEKKLKNIILILVVLIVILLAFISKPLIDSWTSEKQQEFVIHDLNSVDLPITKDTATTDIEDRHTVDLTKPVHDVKVQNHDTTTPIVDKTLQTKQEPVVNAYKLEDKQSVSKLFSNLGISKANFYKIYNSQNGKLLDKVQKEYPILISFVPDSKAIRTLQYRTHKFTLEPDGSYAYTTSGSQPSNVEVAVNTKSASIKSALNSEAADNAKATSDFVYVKPETNVLGRPEPVVEQIKSDATKAAEYNSKAASTTHNFPADAVFNSYTLQKGETLSSLFRKIGIPTNDIYVILPYGNKVLDTVQDGQEIKIAVKEINNIKRLYALSYKHYNYIKNGNKVDYFTTK